MVSAVSFVMVRHRDWTNKGLAWIEAFDSLPLLQIVETMRGLNLFKEESLAHYLSMVLSNKLLKLFNPDAAKVPEVKRPYRRRLPGETPAKKIRIGKRAEWLAAKAAKGEARAAAKRSVSLDLKQCSTAPKRSPGVSGRENAQRR